MSNIEAAKLYASIIEDVIADSRQDFEDSGIDEATLQDLRRIWMDKLSQTGVADFAWNHREEGDDIPVSSIGISNLDNIPRSSGIVDTSRRPNVQSITQQHHHLPQIPEPQPVLDELSYPTSSMSSYSNSLQLPTVQHSYGLQLPIQLPNSANGGQPKVEDNGLILPNINQADGTFEFTVEDPDQQLTRAIRAGAAKRDRKLKLLAQADGADDSSDDINSDLDDSEVDSNNSDEEDGDMEGMIMLCLYDKVQRVKNKWKSNLKDGIANINGKDYAFQKATGECEW